MAQPVSQSPPAGKIPVLERITRNILATLGTIKKAKGYSFDSSPTRPNPAIGDTMIDGRLILVVGDDPTKEDDPPQQLTQWLQKFYVVAEVVQSETDYIVSVDQRRVYALADIQYALTFDADLGARPNQTRRDLDTGNPLAEDTMIEDPIIPMLDENANAGQVVAVVSVRYRTRYNDPFTSYYDS